MRTKPFAGTATRALKLTAAGSLALAVTNNMQAAEKKSYSKPPFAPFSSQMPDALLGNGKYEKPLWNLHDALNLPKWLS
ncbi:MAG: alginate export family protein, partial [Methylococcaceae bacterium]